MNDKSEQIEIRQPALLSPSPTGPAEPPEILYIDDEIIAVNKPSGEKVHRSKGDRRDGGYLVNRIRRTTGIHVYPVHRLDRPTSGVLVFARTKEAAAHLSRSFAKKRIQKRYLAVTRGWVPESGEIDYPLSQEKKEGRTGDRKYEAVTRFIRLATAEIPAAIDRYPQSRYSLVEAIPLTGRIHQIRRHFRHLRYPLINDRMYGDNKHNRYFKHEIGIDRLLLAAVEIRFPHPADESECRIAAPPAEDFLAITRMLGWQDELAAS